MSIQSYVVAEAIKEQLLKKLKALGKYDRHPQCREFVNEASVRQIIKEVCTE